MTTVLVLSGIIILILCIERLVAIKVTGNPAGREFIRRHTIFHPNAISLIRMPMGLISVWFGLQGWWPAAILWFAIWMISDMTDGTIARNCDLGSETGKWLDPLSDKCMSFPGLLFFALNKSVAEGTRLSLFNVLVFIAIDVFGQCSRLFSRKKAANPFGKAKTALVTILLALLSLNQIYPVLASQSFYDIMMVSCTILAFLSVYCKIIPDNWYANSLTLANFCCGLGAIWFAFSKGWHARAFGLVFLGQFFDLFDGRMARKYGSTRLGAIFDDIADATSFGFGIGAVIYCGLVKRPPCFNCWLAIATTVFYIACLLYRLYRFLKPTIDLPPGVFQGLPSPAGALMAGSLILVTFQFDSVLVNYAAALGVIIVSLLMVSNVKYKHFGQKLWPTLPRTVKMLLFVLLLVFANFAIVFRNYWEQAFVWFCLALGLLYIVGAVNHQKQAEQPAGEQ